MKPHWPGMLLLFIALVTPGASAADRAHRLTVVLSADEQTYHSTWDSFRDTLLHMAGPAIPFSIELVTLNNGYSDRSAHKGSIPDLVIPIGAQAARFAHEHYPSSPIFNILITRDAFKEIWPRDRIRARTRNREIIPAASALFLDQPFDRQFRLLHLALPDIRRASVLLGAHSRHLKSELIAAARRSNIDLQIVDFASARNAVEAFDEALELGEAVLVLPDSEVITPTHAKWLLYMAYQNQVPVIGFSQALVDAGALAALYTSPAQVGRQAAEAVIDMALASITRPGRPWRLPTPAPPDYFDVAINRAVARSFGIEMLDQQRLAHSLIAVEGADRWQADR